MGGAPFIGMDFSGVKGVKPFTFDEKSVRRGGTKDHLLLSSGTICHIFTDLCQVGDHQFVIPGKGILERELAISCLKHVGEKVHHCFDLEAKLPKELSSQAELIGNRFLVAQPVCDIDVVPVRVIVTAKGMTFEDYEGKPATRDQVIDVLERLRLVEVRGEGILLMHALECSSRDVFDWIQELLGRGSNGVKGVRIKKIVMIWIALLFLV